MRYALFGAGLAGLMVIVGGSSLSAAPSRKQQATARPASMFVASDPSGTYAGYPEWARRALAPKAGGGR